MLHTAKDSEELYQESLDLNKADAELLLKSVSLQQVKNVFWHFNNLDVHRALSWDRLHAYQSSLFGGHLWPAFKAAVEELGRSAIQKIDLRFDLIPRWKGLNHFDQVMSIAFNDGSKYEDMSKQLLYVAHNIFTMTESEHGYRLLQLIRSYLELDLYLSFKVHTTESICASQSEVINFSKLLQEYIKATPDSDKNWDFPKAHSHTHTFHDVEQKGVSQNYSTKPNKKMHGPMRVAYQLQTNYKNVEGQILRVEHKQLLSKHICVSINDLDERNSLAQEEAGENDMAAENGDKSSKSAEKKVQPPSVSSGHYNLGSPQPTLMYYKLQEIHSGDNAFRDFRRRLNTFLNFSMPLPGLKDPDNTKVSLGAHENITVYQFLKVNYESMVTWKLITDYLRCTPIFHRHPRYDFVIISTTGSDIFAQLILMFTCTIEETKQTFALIQAYDALIKEIPETDLNLGFHRLRAKPRSSSEFVFLESIIRGAVLIQDFERDGEYLVLNVLDADMFMQIKKMKNN